ncbi:Dynein heavy chain 2, axonemal [Cichlidogyrus casuarinus]|uniref:Dynein heavy chain 2, axonemal n=1 Tax=Cichlidogyrus casuarinus TaxID=1844966 RepID=A0ABD2Q1Y8_9PLAT
MKTQRKKQRAVLDKLSQAIRTNLTAMQRLKINSLAVIEVHQRDIIEKLYKSGVMDTNAFDWLSQLRFYWEKDVDDCVTRQTMTFFLYAYEYLGNSGRLVITPLTDRCYITLTTALHMFRGGSPKGPAGTGKTETTKDLGKSLGTYVIVINCSEGLDYKSMGRMFSGLSQTGAWGCFDEFNRINIEVLSVVAQQILSILSALSVLGHQYENPEKGSFLFEGSKINLHWNCGMFITMNPGYAGRTELPDNLKSMFRPIAMVVPDSTMIAEITLFAEGFGSTKVLAKKVYTLYSLSVQQLSKQDHYDFGLRALVSVLRYAGRKRRANPHMNDEEIILLSMNDMNLAKLTKNDLPLFKGIVSDLFPGTEIPSIDYSKFNNAFKKACLQMGLQPISFSLQKCIQLYETQTSRHSVMIVGKTMSGKSTTWKTLQNVHAIMNTDQEPGWQKVTPYPLNPKSISLGELYGEFNLATNEWTDGVLSSVMRICCSDDKPDYKWVLFDGPVDAVWIESMNSVMDDNKILTLINGERISMPPQVSLLFEVEDLAVASPATVSRCGMVYNDVSELGFWPYVNSWLATKTDKTINEELKRLCEKYIRLLLTFIDNHCSNLIIVSPLNTVVSLCRLFDAIATEENGFSTKDPETLRKLTELYFQFSLIWSVCGALDAEGRKKVDTYLRDMEGTFPNKDTIYEYYVNSKGLTWAHWEDQLQQNWAYDPEKPFYRIIVPTVDTIRYNYLVMNLVASYHPVLLVGPVGTGKTSIIQNCLDQLDKYVWSSLSINMSAQTSSSNVQDIIEGRLEKRSKGVFVPKLLTVMDDFNMPAKDTYGSQPPLELIRQWLDYGFWYNRQKQTVTNVANMYLLSAMGPPGGGRMVISRRLQSKFNCIVLNFPTPANLYRIFGSMLAQKMHGFEDDAKTVMTALTDATLELYNRVVSRFLPTPAKLHYLFNLRDISKVFQGLLRADSKLQDTRSSMLRLWIHESFRVFADRLVDEKDHQSFMELLSEQLGHFFDTTFNNLCPSKSPPIFTHFMHPSFLYEDVQNVDKLRTFLNNTLDEYNNTPGTARIELVLFRDAMEHICKLVRVITQARGNMLFIGIGGSGRQSLSRLSAFLCGYKTFQIEISKHYKKADFREDLKKLYIQCGVQNRPTLFVFLDTQVTDESFLEDINNMLSSGEVPNLFKPDEFEEIRDELADICKKEYFDDSPQTVFRFLVDRVKSNLHIVLCMSPIGEPFRNRMRMYPSLINCTTIDWFSEWPEDALLEVAQKYLADVSFWPHDYEDKIRKIVAKVCAKMHRSVSKMSDTMFSQMKRKNYVTPTNYLELVAGYKKLLDSKRQDLYDNAQKLKNGLSKIDETRSKVEIMFEELEDARKKVQQFQKECDEYLVILVQQKREADEQAKVWILESTREDHLGGVL